MHVLGEYIGASRSLEGDLIVSFSIDENARELEKLEASKGQELVIDAKKYNAKRSLNANAYLWVLCDKIANRLNTTKDAIYLMLIKHYGVCVDVSVIDEAVDALERQFRYVEAYDDGLGKTLARCYIGSSHYDKAEMQRLIDGAIQEAQEQGVDVLSSEEVDRLIQLWEA